MTPYVALEMCSKCGGVDMGDSYHKPATAGALWGPTCWLDEPCLGQTEEHILRHCRRCSHEWFTGIAETACAITPDYSRNLMSEKQE